jgi:hypothetical protein
MKSARHLLAPLLALGLLLAAFGWLFKARLGGGEVYPEYSSLRADPLGTRAFFEALQSFPALQVERDYHPLARLGAAPRLDVLPGLSWREWQQIPATQLSALNAAVQNGARVVLAFRADYVREDGGTPADKSRAGAAQPEAKGKKEAAKKKVRRPGEKETEPVELAKAWGVAFKLQRPSSDSGKASRTAAALSGLPEELVWRSELTFVPAPDSGWQVIYRHSSEPVLLEKKTGRGSIVLLADSYVLSNEAAQRNRAPALLSWLVGQNRRIAFSEGALGVQEENGIGSLARHYGLGGSLALCVILGLLYAWQRLAAFRPMPEEAVGNTPVVLRYEPVAGLTGLLRRSLNRGNAMGVCVEEWRKSRPDAHRNSAAGARLEAAWQARAQENSQAAVYNALVRALKLK